MEIRLFQIVVPLIAILGMIFLVRRYNSSNITVYELVLGALFWFSVGIFAIFPDYLSGVLAKLIGIKDNANAILFLCIGVIFYVLFKMYFMIKNQDKTITDLVRHIAIEDKSDKKNQ